jgi:hypothetical protein
MPVYNHYYPDSGNRIGTLESANQLALFGPTVPVTVSITTAHAKILQELNMPAPTPTSGLALIDTGATSCCVDEQVVITLGVRQFGTTTIATPGGATQEVATYPAALSFPGTTLPNISFIDFIGSPLQAQGIIAIIGRNVLRAFVLVYNGPGGFVSLAH